MSTDCSFKSILNEVSRRDRRAGMAKKSKSSKKVEEMVQEELTFLELEFEECKSYDDAIKFLTDEIGRSGVDVSSDEVEFASVETAGAEEFVDAVLLAVINTNNLRPLKGAKMAKIPRKNLNEDDLRAISEMGVFGEVDDSEVSFALEEDEGEPGSDPETPGEGSANWGAI